MFSCVAFVLFARKLLDDAFDRGNFVFGEADWVVEIAGNLLIDFILVQAINETLLGQNLCSYVELVLLVLEKDSPRTHLVDAQFQWKPVFLVVA